MKSNGKFRAYVHNQNEYGYTHVLVSERFGALKVIGVNHYDIRGCCPVCGLIGFHGENICCHNIQEDSFRWIRNELYCSNTTLSFVRPEIDIRLAEHNGEVWTTAFMSGFIFYCSVVDNGVVII